MYLYAIASPEDTGLYYTFLYNRPTIQLYNVKSYILKLIKVIAHATSTFKDYNVAKH
jgi:hypothetical protein